MRDVAEAVKTKSLLLVLYDDVVAASGGAVALRDEGLLDSALARPINRRAYEGVEDLVARNEFSIADLATWLRGHTARRRS